MKKIILAALLVNAAAAGSALAETSCNVPMEQWQPREALQAKLEKDGWQVRQIKTEGGCYEAYAIDKDGNRVEVVFNPKTFEPVTGAEDGEDSEG